MWRLIIASNKHTHIYRMHFKGTLIMVVKRKKIKIIFNVFFFVSQRLFISHIAHMREKNIMFACTHKR